MNLVNIDPEEAQRKAEERERKLREREERERLKREKEREEREERENKEYGERKCVHSPLSTLIESPCLSF